MRYLGKFIKYLMLALVVLVLSLYIAIHLPSVQRIAIDKALVILKDYFDADVSIEGFALKPFNTIVVKNLTIIDLDPQFEGAKDTLLHVGRLDAKFSLMSLIGPGHEDFILKRIRVDDADFYLVIEGGEEYSTNLNRMMRNGKSKPAREMKQRDIFNIKHLDGHNLHFIMQNFGLRKLEHLGPGNIDWTNFEVYDGEVVADEFRMSHGLFYADVKHLAMKETSGWEITHMSASTVSGQGHAYINDIHFEDHLGGYADLDFEMIGRTDDYKDYVNRVEMVANVHKSRLSLSALSHFVPVFNADPTTFVEISGLCTGPVADLRTDGIDIKVENSTIKTHLSGNVGRLPNYRIMTINANCTGTEFTTADVTKFLHAIAPKTKKLDLGRFGAGKLYKADIQTRGDINDLKCKVALKQGTVYGSALINAHVLNTLKSEAISVSGDINSEMLDLGVLLGFEKLGPASISGKYSATLPMRESALKANIEDLDIKAIEFNGYDYKKITGKATLMDSELNADIHSDDDNCDVDVTLWTDKYSYNAACNVRNADLKAMNFDKRDKSDVAFNLYAHLDRDLDHLHGNATLTDIHLSNSEGTQQVSDITLDAQKEGDTYDIALSSEDLQGTFNGNLKHLDATVDTYNTTALLAYLIPGAYIDNGTHVHVTMTEEGDIDGDITSHRLALRENYIKDLRGKVSGSLKDLDLDLDADEIRAIGFTLNNNKVNVCYVDSVAHVTYGFHNDSPKLTKGELDFNATLGAHKRFAFDIQPTTWFVNGDKWDIAKSFVQIRNKEIDVNGLCINNGNQLISMNGGISHKHEDMMTAQIKNFDISVFNHVIKKMDLDLAGIINAEGNIESPIGNGIPKITLNLLGDKLKMGEYDLGRLAAACDYDNSLDHFYISANQRIAGKDALQASAILTPGTEHLDASIYADHYPFNFAQKFIPFVFKRMEGDLSGTFFVNGPLKELDFSSRNARVDNTLLDVGFTHVPYTLAGTLHMDNDGIHLDNVVGHDRFGSVIHPSGGLKWDRARNLKMDVTLNVENCEALDIPAGEGTLAFYGHVFGTGKVTFKGPFRNLVMSINAQAAPNSQMHFFIPKSANATKSNLLTFVDPSSRNSDPYEKILTQLEEKRRKSSEFIMNLHASADPAFKVFVDLGGDQFAAGLEGVGNGVIDIDVNTATGEYGMHGDYVMTEGKVDVNVSNIVHRNFDIAGGSSIRFQGEILESVVNLDANYETKASISSLIADDEGASNRRSVLCGINISNKLSNPDIKFNINVPDLNPSVKTQVESALSTDDKLQKQFLSLLLSNNFLPDEQNNIVNNNSLLFSNVSEIMASQVNNIFNKLDIPLDLGLNYQPSEQGGKDMFDVALSTQLFNNRVIIGGNFGNRQNLTSNTGTFFGDLDVQYKVTRNGALRVKAFSHSADKYSNFLDNGQRNGVGISWQQEFDNFPSWFKGLFSSRVAREALKQMDALKIKEEKTIVLDE